MITTATFAALLKRLYSPKAVQYMAFKNRPFLGLVKKNTANFGGSSYSVPVEFGRTPGRSTVFATAQANSANGGTRSATFLVTRARDYGIARIQTELMLASKGSNASFMPAVKNTMERTIDTVAFQLSKDLWSNGGGSLGQISAGSNVATATITLTNVEDAINFYPGQVLEVSADDGIAGGGVKAGDGAGQNFVTVQRVDYTAGTLTTTVAWDVGIPAVAPVVAGDFIFQQGDYGAKMPGIPAWIPAAAPVATVNPLYGVDRGSLDVNALAGIRPDVTGASTIHEKLILACGTSARLGGAADHIFMNPEDVSDMVLELEGKTEYVRAESKKQEGLAVVGYDAIKLMTPMGAVKVLADQHVPKSRIWGLNMDSWELGSLGGAPIVLADSDEIFVWNADAREIRVGYYGALYCTAPQKNFTCAL